MLGLGQGDSIDSTALVVAFVAVTLMVCVAIDVFGGRRRGPSSWKGHSRYQFSHQESCDLTKPAEQMNAVMAASFEKQKLLNFSEYRVFRVIENMIAEAPRGYRVFAQINLGEILRSPDDNAYRSINSKRVDILIVDRRGLPMLAVEYQGGRHYQGVAAARDAVKKEALRKAGVAYIEIVPADNDEDIRSLVRKHLHWNATTEATGRRIPSVTTS